MELLGNLEPLTSGRSYPISERQCKYKMNGWLTEKMSDLKCISFMNNLLKHKYKRLERVSLRIRELEGEKSELKYQIDKILDIIFAKASDHEEPKKPKKWKPARRPVMHIKTGQKYDSMADAARAYNIDKSTFRKHLTSKYRSNKYPFKFI